MIWIELKWIELHTKLIFPGALKKALMFLEDRFYQTQYFAKIFSSSLASTLHVHFYLYLKESSENVLWIVIALKSAYNVHQKLLSKLAYFVLFLKTWLKVQRRSWWLCLFSWNRLVLHISFFCMFYLLLLGKTP